MRRVFLGAWCAKIAPCYLMQRTNSQQPNTLCSLAHKHASQLVVDNSHMEVETFGGVPKPPTPATLGGHDWPVEGSIQFGVAKTPINSAYNAEFCDPLLGQIDGKVRLMLALAD